MRASSTPVKMPVWEGQGVQVEDVAGFAAQHHDAHGRGPDEGRVEVSAEQVVLSVRREVTLMLDQLFLGVGQARRVLVRPPLLQQMPECLTKKSAGSAGGVEDGLVFFRVEDVDHKPNRGRWREVLTAVSAQVVSDKFLVGDAFDVGVGPSEVVGRDLPDYERQRAV